MAKKGKDAAGQDAAGKTSGASVSDRIKSIISADESVERAEGELKRAKEHKAEKQGAYDEAVAVRDALVREMRGWGPLFPAALDAPAADKDSGEAAA